MAGIGIYKPIKIYQISSSQDSNGDMVENTTLLFTAWAEVENIGGSSSLQNGKTNLQDTKRFKVRFRPDMILTSNWVIQYYGKIYSISNIERINEKRFNYLITATGTYNTLTTINTIFPNGTPVGGGGGGTSPAPVTNWTSSSYAGSTGQFTLSGGTGDALTELAILKYPYDGTGYINAYNESFSVGAFPGNTIDLTYFTPGQALLRYRRLQPNPPYAPITATSDTVLTITRLSRRPAYVYNVLDNTYIDPIFFPLIPINVNGVELTQANNINEFISIMNADPANAACIFLHSYSFASNRISINVDPIAPYQTWGAWNRRFTARRV